MIGQTIHRRVASCSVLLFGSFYCCIINCQQTYISWMKQKYYWSLLYILKNILKSFEFNTIYHIPGSPTTQHDRCLDFIIYAKIHLGCNIVRFIEGDTKFTCTKTFKLFSLFSKLVVFLQTGSEKVVAQYAAKMVSSIKTWSYNIFYDALDESGTEEEKKHILLRLYEQLENHVSTEPLQTDVRSLTLLRTLYISFIVN